MRAMLCLLFVFLIGACTTPNLSYGLLDAGDSAVDAMGDDGATIDAAVVDAMADATMPIDLAKMVVNEPDMANVPDLVMLPDLVQHPLVLSFAASTNYQSGVQANPNAGGLRWIGAADLNGDGATDLTFSNSIGYMGVLIGNGKGMFAAAANYMTNGQAWYSAVGDVSGDGKPDVIVANANNGMNVAVFINNGNGTFPNPAMYAAGQNAHATGIADANGDGKPDLFVSNSASNDVTEFLGDGKGKFTGSGTYPTGNDPSTMIVGDLNNDGQPDVVTGNYTDGNLTVLLDIGNGILGFPMPVATPQGLMAMGDINNDGKRDVVVANYGPNGGMGGSINFLPGRGDGTFVGAIPFAKGTAPNAVAIGDMNADGSLDIVAVHDAGNVGILLGDGKGAFAAEVTYPVGLRPLSVVVGDFNGDKLLDIAVANSKSNDVSILLNTSH